MKTVANFTGALLAVALAAGAAGSARAADARDVLVVRVKACEPTFWNDCRTRPPRVRPASYIKLYPFGQLREDYTPYGMPGVPARLYFDVIRGRG